MWLTVVSFFGERFVQDIFLFFFCFWLYFELAQFPHHFLTRSSKSDGYWNFNVALESASDWPGFSGGILMDFCKYRVWGKNNRIHSSEISNYLQGSTQGLTARTSATTEDLWNPVRCGIVSRWKREWIQRVGSGRIPRFFGKCTRRDSRE